MRQFTALIEVDPETAQYVGIVPGIPGAHTQAATLDELRVNLKEVLELCLEEMGEAAGSVLLEDSDLPEIGRLLPCARSTEELVVEDRGTR